tara:strand:- start:407 stop:664 length:258 start_codon:yes stop_codon:yes gene_type:complete
VPLLRWQITVDVPWYYQLPKHGFIVEKKMRIMAHDEYELCEQGDLVRRAAPKSHARPPCAQPRLEAKRDAETRCEKENCLGGDAS